MMVLQGADPARIPLENTPRRLRPDNPATVGGFTHISVGHHPDLAIRGYGHERHPQWWFGIGRCADLEPGSVPNGNFPVRGHPQTAVGVGHQTIDVLLPEPGGIRQRFEPIAGQSPETPVGVTIPQGAFVIFAAERAQTPARRGQFFPAGPRGRRQRFAKDPPRLVRKMTRFDEDETRAISASELRVLRRSSAKVPWRRVVREPS